MKKDGQWLATTFITLITFACLFAFDVYKFQVENSHFQNDKTYRNAGIRADDDPHAHMIILGDSYGVGFERDQTDGVSFDLKVSFSASAFLIKGDGTIIDLSQPVPKG